jgi:hypothetical protein
MGPSCEGLKTEEGERGCGVRKVDKIQILVAAGTGAANDRVGNSANTAGTELANCMMGREEIM